MDGVGVDRADVLAAGVRLRRFLAPTPLRATRGARLKLESLQVTGPYKGRGALNALLLQRAAGDDRPVIAASAGNHGAGVAWAAHVLGMKATIVVPEGAPRRKVDRIRRLGADVEEAGIGFGESLAIARRQGQAVVIAHPYPITVAFLQEKLASLPEVVVLTTLSELVTPRKPINRSGRGGIALLGSPASPSISLSR